MKYLNLVVLLVVLGGTVGLFYLLAADTESSLFYFNLGVACVLEFILFGSVIAVAGKRLFNIPYLAITTQLSRFVVLVALIMLVYNFFGQEYVAVKWYYGALILLSMIQLSILIFVYQGARVQLDQLEDAKPLAKSRANLKAEQQKLTSRLTGVLRVKEELDYPLREACEQAIRQMGDKAGALPMAKLERNSDKVAEVCLQITNLNRDADQLESAAGPEECSQLVRAIIQKSNQISAEINLIINL